MKVTLPFFSRTITRHEKRMPCSCQRTEPPYARKRSGKATWNRQYATPSANANRCLRPEGGATTVDDGLDAAKRARSLAGKRAASFRGQLGEKNTSAESTMITGNM